jgi:hypothetical protein
MVVSYRCAMTIIEDDKKIHFNFRSFDGYVDELGVL